MSLSHDQIKNLLAQPEKKPRGAKKGIDTSVRDFQTWFKLAHKLYDEDAQSFAKCDNPNCQDTRTKGILVAIVDGHKMCRICFLDGWQLENPEQATLPLGGD